MNNNRFVRLLTAQAVSNLELWYNLCWTVCRVLQNLTFSLVNNKLLLISSLLICFTWIFEASTSLNYYWRHEMIDQSHWCVKFGIL